MFDARKLLEAMLGGGARQTASEAPSAGGGGLADILGQVLGQGGRGGAPAGGQGGPQGGPSLEDLLRRVGGAQGQGQGGAQGAPTGGPSGGPSGGMGGLEDILRRMGGQMGGQPQGGSEPPASAPSGRPGAQGGPGGLGDLLEQLQRQAGGQGGAGGIADILRQVLGQATSGAREGASRIGEATGARETLERATGGRSADDLAGQLREWISQNQLGAGAAAGGLGAVILGTQTGRRMAGSALKLGALALIGGLAYKAYQNYSQGRPVVGGQALVDAAPQGSGFEAQALTNESATLYIRTMIAAAAADGRLDEAEQQRILGALRQGGLDQEGQAFLDDQIQNPASVDELVAAVTSPELAIQVYSAARIAIDPDTQGEKAFLEELASKLGIDAALATHIDALATGSA